MRRRDRHPRAPLVLAFAGLALAGGVSLAAEAAPPDLRLEWLVHGKAVREGVEPLHGRRGETVAIAYRLRNVGGSDAFTVILESRTALGRAARPERVHPGPDAGKADDRSLRLALAEGMRELCIDARLQTLAADDPGDPNAQDNRICRRVEVRIEDDAVVERRRSR